MCVQGVYNNTNYVILRSADVDSFPHQLLISISMSKNDKELPMDDQELKTQIAEEFRNNFIYYEALAKRTDYEEQTQPKGKDKTYICYNLVGLQENIILLDFSCFICSKFTGVNFSQLRKHYTSAHSRFVYEFSNERSSNLFVDIYLKKYPFKFDKEVVVFPNVEIDKDLNFTAQIFSDFCKQNLLEKSFLSDDEKSFMLLWTQHALEKRSFIYKVPKKTSFEALFQSFIPTLAETIVNSGENSTLRDCFVRFMCNLSRTHHGLLKPTEIVMHTKELDEKLKCYSEIKRA